LIHYKKLKKTRYPRAIFAIQPNKKDKAETEIRGFSKGKKFYFR